MEDNVRLAGIENRLGSLTSDSASVKTDVGTIKTELGEVRRDVASINGGINTLKWVVGLSLIGAFAIFATAGRSFVRETAREVAVEVNRQEQAYRQSWSQKGKLNDGTRVTANSFHWNLTKPVDPKRLVSMQTEQVTPLPNVVVTATPDEDGKGCTMMLHGSAEAIEALPADAELLLLITERADAA